METRLDRRCASCDEGNPERAKGSRPQHALPHALLLFPLILNTLTPSPLAAMSLTTSFFVGQQQGSAAYVQFDESFGSKVRRFAFGPRCSR